MATPDSSLIQTPVSFDSDAFKGAIRYAMQMGAPAEAGQQATFVFADSSPTYWKNGQELLTAPRLDRDGKPLDPEVEVRATAGAEVAVDCSVAFTERDTDETPVGMLGSTKVEVTLLGEQYALVKGARSLRFNGDDYVFGYEHNMGLFDVAVHVMVFYPKDEN